MKIYSKNSDIKHSIITTEETIGNVTHPNESLYIIELKKPFDKNEMLILSQSYDAGWAAYYAKNANFMTQAFPFLFGKKLNEHVMVNNWSNGWGTTALAVSPPASEAKTGVVPSVNADQTVIIVYAPQYLEYFGFVLLGVTFLLLTFKLLKASK